jgi:hypothetical protein
VPASHVKPQALCKPMNRINPLSEAEFAAASAEVVRTANALTAREISFIEGIRNLRSLAHSASHMDHDPDFMLFVAIDSQSDHIPGAAARSMCSDSWLAACDREAKRLEDFYETEVKAACNRLIERFSGEA